MEEFKAHENNQNKVAIENKLYKLIEMKDAMDKSIDNINVITRQLSLLIDIVKQAEQKELDEFIAESKKQLEHLHSQLVTLQFRRDLLAEIIKRCQDNNETSETVSILLTALGVFENA